MVDEQGRPTQTGEGFLVNIILYVTGSAFTLGALIQFGMLAYKGILRHHVDVFEIAVTILGGVGILGLALLLVSVIDRKADITHYTSQEADRAA